MSFYWLYIALNQTHFLDYSIKCWVTSRWLSIKGVSKSVVKSVEKVYHKA